MCGHKMKQFFVKHWIYFQVFVKGLHLHERSDHPFCQPDLLKRTNFIAKLILTISESLSASLAEFRYRVYILWERRACTITVSQVNSRTRFFCIARHVFQTVEVYWSTSGMIRCSGIEKQRGRLLTCRHLVCEYEARVIQSASFIAFLWQSMVCDKSREGMMVWRVCSGKLKQEACARRMRRNAYSWSLLETTRY